MNRCNAPFHHMTIDQVNAATAEELAEQHDILMELVEPRDLPRLEKESASLIADWDFLPEDYRDRLLNSPTLRVVAIYGYNIPESIARFLARRGILCFPKLGPELFASVKLLAPAA